MTDERTGIKQTLADPSTIIVAGLAGVAGVLGSFATAGFTPTFVGAPVASLLTNVMPGEIVTFAILFLGSLGQLLNLAMALALTIAALAVVSLLAIAFGKQLESPLVSVGLVGLLVWLVSAAITGAPVLALGSGVAAAAVVGVGRLFEAGAPPVEGGEKGPSHVRRRILGSLAVVGAVGLLGRLLQRSQAAVPPAVSGSSPADTGGLPGVTAEERRKLDQLLEEAEGKSMSIAGIEPLVSEEFYQVDINAADPDLDASEWTLSITGAVEEEITLDYEDLTSMPVEHHFNTLRCVGESLNGHKMDNALWTGTPVTDLVGRAGPQGGCECVMLRAADDYFEEFPLAALRRGFLAWGMNGGFLPRAHGYPVRALIPGHWGEINVKWITEIEILERQVDGYWEQRGWHGTGPVETVAKLHAVNHLEDGRIQVGGHAYAGTRGIDRVEVQITGSDWQEATLSEPLPGEDVWRQWRYEFTPNRERHGVVVRAIDGEGRVQPEEDARAFPSGATGWVRQTVRR